MTWIACVKIDGGKYGVGEIKDTSAAALAAVGTFLNAVSVVLNAPPALPSSVPTEQREIVRTSIAGFQVVIWWEWQL
jgi:hypothetical protein